MADEEDAVKVCVRVRPTIQREQGDQVNLFWKSENSTISQVDGARSFHFDRVFNSLETTAQVYQEVAVPIIRSALQGYNGTIFAYGQTSSGKTYTMMGTPDCLGIIPQAVKEVFTIIQEIPNREFLLRVSYMEIYNETVTDLLCDSRKKKPLEVREDINRNVYVADLTEELVMNPEHVLQWIKKGEKNRHYGETKMNEHSSRSHTIFRMIVESRESNDASNSENNDGAVMVSHLNLVDLAGSERASQTGAEGVRLKEGCNINRSLFILGQVIKKLSDDQSGLFINYRDSKLTRILQNSLGGNTKTVIICTITPVSFDETLSTLQFASAAKNVKNKPHVNEVLDDKALLKRYRNEIMDLKKQLEVLEASSVSKANAMANEEHSQLLAVIQQLQKEKQDRISNLKNIVVDTAVSQDLSQEDQPSRRKRRVTWAAEKIQSTLFASGVNPFNAGSKISANLPKRAKLSDLQRIHENDDSICTEFSDFDDASRVFEDFCPDWENGSRVTFREKTSLHHSMIDLHSDAQPNSGALFKDFSSPKCEELEQKLAELENRLNTMAKDYEMEVERRELFEKETLNLKQQLEAKEEEKEVLLQTHELEITTLKDQLQQIQSENEVRVGFEASCEPEVLDTNNLELSQVKENSSHQSSQTVQVQEDCVEHISSDNHDLCKEQIQMLEQKIADLEAGNQQNDFVESLQICEALMSEKETALNELCNLRENFDSVVVENESLKQEIAVMEKYIQERNETNEFELLEKETQKEHEAQLIHEITSLKKVVENAELYNQELEVELENKSNVLKEQEKVIAELKRDAEVFLKKARYSDLSASMGADGEKLCEEVFQLKQSMDDAETVTRDAQREAAFLRSENIELKEKMDELVLRCEQKEKDASAFEKLLENEKSNYKRMQADLQKELQCAFNEINELNGLLAGKVPKDLLSRVELEKINSDCAKQLANALAEKSALETEVADLSKLKSLPSEIELLMNQVQKASEEILALQKEKEQSMFTISDQNSTIQQQCKQTETLMEEMATTQENFQHAEQQYAKLKILYEDLQTTCSLTDEEIKKKDSQVESLLKEINDLKQSIELLELKLSRAQDEREELVQAQQERTSNISSLEEMLKSSMVEIDGLQEQVSNLSSLVETLRQQEERHSELFRENQDLAQKNLQLMGEMEQLQERLSNMQPSLGVVHPENLEEKLQQLQEEMLLLSNQREDLNSKLEELTAEKNILKQDLNDNIEMSIETQDELRTTQEELKCQKQLVADLRKQISEYDERFSVQAESYGPAPEPDNENSETIIKNKMELEADSQMEDLHERIKAAELAFSTVEIEKNELFQKLHATEEDLQSVTGQRDELENTKNNLLKEMDDLQNELQKTAKQVYELEKEINRLSKLSHEDVTGQHLEEKEKLLEALKAITDERDQLKLDLNDNIEMSIETQEELRNALDELKEKSRLLDSLKQQADQSSTGQTNNLEKELGVDVLHLKEQLCAIESERDQLREEFRLLTEQKRSLEELHSATNDGFQYKETHNKEVQVLSVVSLEEEMSISAKLEEAETERTLLKERFDHLLDEIEHHQHLIDSLKEENLQLAAAVQRHTEDEAVQNKHTEDLTSVIKNLKEQLENTSQQLALKEQEARVAAENLMELNNTEKHISESEILKEDPQQEKQEFSDKVCALQEELEKMACYRDELQEKLQMVLSENASLKETLETALSSSSTQEELQGCQDLQQHMQISDSVSVQDKDTSTDLLPIEDDQVLGLQEQLLQKVSEYEHVLQMKNKLEEDQNDLSSVVENLTNSLTDAQSMLESLQNEKQQMEEHLLDLQQKLNSAVQERDLKVAQERSIADIDQLKSNLMENNKMDLGLQEQLLQKSSEYEQLIKMKNKLEEDKDSLSCEVKTLTNMMKEAQTNLDCLQKEKHQTEEELFELQQKLNATLQDRDDLMVQQERLIAEINELKNNLKENEEMVLQLKHEIEHRINPDNDELEQTQHIFKKELEQAVKDLKKTETQLETLRIEKLDSENNLLHLQQKLDIVTQEWDELKALQESLILERDQLKKALEKNADMLKTTENQQPLSEVAAQTETLINSEMDQLLNNLKDMESQLSTLQRENIDKEEKLFNLQEHMEAIIKERDELQSSLQCLQSERDQLKDDLRENIEMSVETQGDLRCTQEELQQQKERVSELTKEIASLEQKSSSLETELHETATALKEVISERDDLDQSKQKLVSEVETLLLQLKEAELALNKAEKEKYGSSQKIKELASVMSSMAEEKDQLNCSKDDVEKQSVEMQNDLRKTQEELQQQKEIVETLTRESSLLEEKLSSLQRELQKNSILLKAAIAEKETLDKTNQTQSSDIEQLTACLKSKDTLLESTESEKREAAQKIHELAVEVNNLSCQRDQLQLFKEKLEEEATKLREDFMQLQHQHTALCEQETQKSSRLEKLLSETEQLKDKLTLQETSAQQLETDKANLQRQAQQYELDMASLHQEQEQFQQLLQRVRSEKENICSSLQDQEKANKKLKESLTTSQTELELVRKQRDESKDNLSEKEHEVNAMLQQLSSLQQQLQQLNRELKDERIKNIDLGEKVDDLEKEIRVLRLMQSEPVEKDELSERSEILQQKNQEFKDLMMNISTMYTNQHSLLGNLSVELETEVEAQKLAISSIRESLSSNQSKEFGTLQTEYIKLNTQLQALLNKFKVIFKNTTVTEEQYSLLNSYESELCTVQKKNDELLLQCQSLEQNGPKWPENAAEELTFCQVEFLNHLIFRKMEVIERVEEGFSEVQMTLNSVEKDLTEEVKQKKHFLSWLETLRGLPFDSKKFSEGILQENKRISGVAQLLTKRLKVIYFSRIKPEIVSYSNQLTKDLEEKKNTNTELLQRMQLCAPSGDSNILEEENAQLCEKLKNLQAELKKMQSRIQHLENEVILARADAKEKGQKASSLQEKLLSSVAENELSEMRAKLSEKEKHLETSIKEIKTLQEKLAQGAAPYQNEIENLKSQLVKFEMDRIKFSKSTDQQIASLKSCVEYKEECLRKLKEQLRRSQKDTDTTICSGKDGSVPYPLTCGGGSGIVQSTAMLMLQSENAALKRENTHFKKKLHLSRSTSIQEEETKLKDKSLETPLHLFSSISDTSSQSGNEAYRQATVSPRKSDIPPSHIYSPGRTGMHRRRAISPSKGHLPKPQVISPSKTHVAKPQVMSPNKTLRHSVPASSLNRKRAMSPFKTEGPLFSNFNESPCKKQSLPESVNSPKDKFFDERSKSLPYCPPKFFDNSTLGTLPDADDDLYNGVTTATNEMNNWWDQADKNKNTNECKTS